MARRGKREGSIYQRTDGRWAASIDLGWDDGRRQRKTFYGPTRQSVSTKLNRALGKHESGDVVNVDDLVTVGRHLDNWLAGISVRPKTRRQYEQVVRLYLKPSIAPVRLTKLTADQIRALVRGLEKRGLSGRTATLARDVLRIALAQAVSDQLVARNVAHQVKRPKARRRQGPVLSPVEAHALLKSLQGHRLEALVTCGVALGLRLGEVLGLQWPDIDLLKGTLTVNRALHTTGKRRDVADLKTQESRRTLMLPALVVRALERHKAAQAERRLAAGKEWQRSAFVFTTRVGRPLEGTLVTRDLKRVLARTWTGGRDDCAHDRIRERECLECGATHLPVVSFHGLRHSCASLLLASGVPMRDVSEWLGHADVRLTMATYAHVLEESRTRSAQAIDRVFDSQSDSQTVGRR